jgi:hypothetical protein
LAQIGNTQHVRLHRGEVRRRRQVLEEFHDAGMPPSDILQDMLQRAWRSLAAAIGDRIGDLATLGAKPLFLLAQVSNADQIRKIWDDPGIARLDEPVIVHRLHIDLKRSEFAFEHV